MAFCLAFTPLLASMNSIRAIALVASSSFFTYSVDAMADAFSDKALEGQKQGKAIIKGFSQPTVDPSSGSVTIHNTTTPITMSRDQLFPGASAEGSDPAALYGSESGISNATTTTSTSYSNTTNTTPTANAYRTLIDGSLNTTTRLPQGDPIATGARDIFSDKNGDISNILKSCTSTTTTVGDTFTPEGSPLLESCQKLTVGTEKCDILHDVEVEKYLTGFTLTIGDSNDTGDYNGSYGKCTLDFKNGTKSCAQTTFRPFQMSVINPVPFEAMCGAPSESFFTLRQFSTSGIDFSPTKTKVYSFTPGHGGCCDVGYLTVLQEPTCANNMVGKYDFSVTCTEDPCAPSTSYTVNKTIAKVNKDEWAMSPGCPANFNAIQDGTICKGTVECTNDDASGCVNIDGFLHCPGGILSQHLKPTPAELTPFGINNICTIPKLIKTCNTCLTPTTCDPASSPTENCAQYTSNPDCRVLRSDCMNGMSNPDGSGCYAYEDSFDCNPEINHTPLYKNCTVVTTASSLPSKVVCSKDSLGVETCETVDFVNKSNSCAALDANKSCKVVYQDCADSLKDPVTEECLATQKTYDCGYPSTPPTVTSSTVATCSGATIRCTGSDCLQLPSEVNNDFGVAAANANIINYAQQDSNCGTTGDCHFFTGTNYSCKTGFFGIVDCCKSPKGVSPFEYLQLLHNTWSLAQDTELGEMLSSTGADISGSLTAFTDPATSALEDVISPITSAFDELTTNVSSVLLQPDSSWLNIAPEISNGLQSFVSSTFGDSVASSMFDITNTADVLSGMAPDYALNVTNLMSTISPLMTAYMIYQIIVLVIEIIYACEDAELELGAKKALKLCHYIGSYCDQKVLGVCVLKKKSYCCFNSPFGRIMQEQIRPQLGISWGSAKHPDCSGITIAQLSSTDFSKVDLSEWIGLLNVAGLQTNSLTKAETDFTIDNITQYNKKSDPTKKNIYDRVEGGVGDPSIDLTNVTEEVKSKL